MEKFGLHTSDDGPLQIQKKIQKIINLLNCNIDFVPRNSNIFIFDFKINQATLNILMLFQEPWLHSFVWGFSSVQHL